MRKRSILRNQERLDNDKEDSDDEQLPPSSPSMESKTKKLKKFLSKESPEFENLQQRISQHNEVTGFVFATEEQKNIFESLISVESDPFIITNEQMHEQIATGLRLQYTMLQNEGYHFDWWSNLSVIIDVNQILCQKEIVDASFNRLKSKRIHTPYDLFLLPDKSLPSNAWESTLMGSVNHLLQYQFKCKRNIIFGTQEAVHLVDRSQVEGTKLENRKKLFPDAYAQLEKAIGDSSLVFFKCEGHKDHFKMYIEIKGMLKEWMDALIKDEKHTIENTQLIKVYGLLVSKFQCVFLEGSIKIHDDHNLPNGIPFGYAIKETKMIDLTTLDGIVEFTTFIESMCEHVYECKQQLAKEVKGEKVSSSSTPIRSKSLSLKDTLRKLNVRFGRKGPEYHSTETFNTRKEGMTSLVETLSPLFNIDHEELTGPLPQDCVAFFVFKKTAPYIWIRNIGSSRFFGVFYWDEDLKYICIIPLSMKSNQESKRRTILDEHRSDDPKSVSEGSKDRSTKFQPQNQSSSSLELYDKYGKDPMSESECIAELEQMLSLSKFNFVPNSMRCEWSCVGFYGHAFSNVKNTSVFVKITAFREENEKVMKKMVHLQKANNAFPNMVRIFDFQHVQSNSKLESIVYNLMKQRNSGENELKKLVHSTQPISITIQEKLLSLEDVLEMVSISEWVRMYSKMFFMNLVKQCFDILFQLDKLNIQHTDISLGNLMIRYDHDRWKRANNNQEKLACFTLVVIDFNSSLLLRERDSISTSNNMFREVLPNQSVDYVYKYPYSDPCFEMKEVDIYSMAVVIVNYLHHITYRKSLKSKMKEPLESCEQYRTEMIDFLNEYYKRNKLFDLDCGKLIAVLKYMLGTTEERQSLDKIKTMLSNMESLGFSNNTSINVEQTRQPLRNISNQKSTRQDSDRELGDKILKNLAVPPQIGNKENHCEQ